MKNKFVWDDSADLECVVKLLDQNGNGVLPVVDDQNRFLGLITDGDIRKAILSKSFDLNHIVNKHAYTYAVDSTVMERVQFLKSIHRRHLPLIDENGTLVDVFVMDDIEFNFKENVVVIMAGGLGSRLGELTRYTPKPMLHVERKPILENVIENFIEGGFHKFIIIVNYKFEQIIEYFGDGRKWGIQINYVHESERMGTAGGLSLIGTKIDRPFIVANADILTKLDTGKLLEFHTAQQSFATICVREYEYSIPYGVVSIDKDKVLSITEKPTYVSYVSAGMYVLSPVCLSLIPKGEYYDMPSLFQLLLEQGKTVSSYHFRDYWLDIGRIEEYERAKLEYRQL